MANQTYDTYPYNLPVSFHFNVNIGGDTKDDIRFQEVNGLTAEISVEELVVGVKICLLIGYLTGLSITI